MGTRGPKKTPTKILELRGSWLAKTRPHEPHPPVARPVCPDWLTPDMKQLWRVVVGQLHAIGLLTKVDGHALARYCALSLRWRKALQFVEKNGETYPVKDATGVVIGLRTFPQVWLVKSLAQELLRLEREFGMTPSARAAFGLMPMGHDNAAQTDPHQDKTRFFTAG